jgi:hypothetical protein
MRDRSSRHHGTDISVRNAMPKRRTTRYARRSRWHSCARRCVQAGVLYKTESEAHKLQSSADAQCKKAFRKDMTTYEEADEFCPHCDNHYVSVRQMSLCTCLPLLHHVAGPSLTTGDRGKGAKGDGRCRRRGCAHRRSVSRAVPAVPDGHEI